MPQHLEMYTVHEGTTLLQAAEKMKQNRARTVLVENEGKIIGVLSEGDLLGALLRGSDVRAQIKGLMSVSYRYLESRDLEKAFALFKKYQFGLLPIVDREMRLKDVITVANIFAELELRK